MNDKENCGIEQITQNLANVLGQKYKNLPTGTLRKEAIKFGLKPKASLSQNRDFWTRKIIVKEVEMIIEETVVASELKEVAEGLESLSINLQKEALKEICKNYLEIHPRIIRQCDLIPIIRKIKVKSKSDQNSQLASKILKSWKDQTSKVIKEQRSK